MDKAFNKFNYYMEKAENAKNQKKFDRYSWKAYKYGMKCKQFMMNEYAMDSGVCPAGMSPEWGVSNQNEMFAVPIANTATMSNKLQQFIENIATSIRVAPQTQRQTRLSTRVTGSTGCVTMFQLFGILSKSYPNIIPAPDDFDSTIASFLSGLTQIISSGEVPLVFF